MEFASFALFAKEHFKGHRFLRIKNKIVPCLSMLNAPRCGVTVLRCDLETKHSPACPKACELGCSSKVAPKDQQWHNDHECPKAVVKCSASDFRCPWRGPRSELSIHTAACLFVQQMPILMALRSLEQRMQAVDQSVAVVP